MKCGKLRASCGKYKRAVENILTTERAMEKGERDVALTNKLWNLFSRGIYTSKKEFLNAHGRYFVKNYCVDLFNFFCVHLYYIDANYRKTP